MKKNVILLSVILIGFALISNATVWRLNNIPGVDADFTTNLQDAIDNVSSGDTIYVEQSPFSYGEATISKKVILIGGGYWLEENDSTNAYIEKSIVEKLIFNPGSEGSILSSFYIYRWFYWGENMTVVEINADDITVQRNYISGDSYEGGDGCVIRINGNRSGIIVQQNWIDSKHPTGTNKFCIYINGTPNDVKIRNNFIKSGNSDQFSVKATIGSSSMGLAVTNNILFGNIETYNEFYINNILLSGDFYNSFGGIAANNICNETQFPIINNNQQNVDMSTVFVDHDLYIDNGYFLVPGSPAIGAGFNGGDCGMFSLDYGGYPYVLSGMPAIPAIFEIDFNSTIFPSNENTLEVDLKAKSHN